MIRVPWRVLPIPRSEMNHGKHDPHIIAEIGLSSMPKSEIANHNRSFLHERLAGASFLLTLFKQMFGDPPTGSVPLLAFLCGQRSDVVGTEPYFCTAVVDVHLDQWNVDNESERRFGMVEICVCVDGLRLRRHSWYRWECAIAGHECQTWFGTEYRSRDLCGQGVEKDRGVEVALRHGGVLLDVAKNRQIQVGPQPSSQEIPFIVVERTIVAKSLEFEGILHHSLIQIVKLRVLNDILQYDKPITMQCPRS